MRLLFTNFCRIDVLIHALWSSVQSILIFSSLGTGGSFLHRSARIHTHLNVSVYQGIQIPRFQLIMLMEKQQNSISPHCIYPDQNNETSQALHTVYKIKVIKEFV